MIRIPARRAFALALFAALALAGLPRVGFAAHPCDPPNVLASDVCNFSTFYGNPPRQLPNGWTAFVLGGDLTYMQDVDTAFGAPALRMWSSGGTFKAGIFTQARVTPGAGYRASISWGAPNAPDTFGRQLGIDPTGGADPNSPNVIWGPVHWGPGRILNYPVGTGPNIDVSARAVGDTMTVFFLTDHNRSTGDNVIFVDAIALYPDESAPTLATPTPLPPPPTNTPAPRVVAAATAAPSSTPTATATLTPTETASPTPTASPTLTATATASPSPTATASPTPSVTPSPTPTSTPTPTFFQRLLPAANGADPAVGMGINLLGLTGLVMAGGLFTWLFRRSGGG